jgi:glycosyltransferase involved in cell wall biosynthesis
MGKAIKKVLWISSIAWAQNGDYPYPLDGPGAVSGSLFQQRMIEGIEENGISVDILAEYPAARGSRIKGFSTKRGNSYDNYTVPIRIPVISQVLKTLKLRYLLHKKLRENDYDAVVAYLIHTPFLLCLRSAKKTSKHVTSMLVCPDLPNLMDMSLEDKPIKRILKHLDAAIIQWLYKYVDCFVLFSKYMKEKIPINNKPYTVIEGIASYEDLDFSRVPKERAIMYAGTLHRNIGLENIIQSIKYIADPNIELWIFGDGDLREVVERESNNNKRIKYFGFCNRKRLFDYEKRATALVNARDSGSSLTRYSFPSKTFEYLLSGALFISTKLPGVPEEYSKYMFEIDNNSPETIARAVEHVFSLDQDQIANKGAEATKFVIEKKNKQIQSAKLLDLLSRTRTGQCFL